MLLEISFKLLCGHNLRNLREYNFKDEIDQSKYESFISFNKPGNELLCPEHNDMRKIKHILIKVIEFDAREIV